MFKKLSSVVLIVAMILCLIACAARQRSYCENCGRETYERVLFSNEKIDKESHWICSEKCQIEFAKKNNFNSWHAVEQ